MFNLWIIILEVNSPSLEQLSKIIYLSWFVKSFFLLAYTLLLSLVFCYIVLSCRVLFCLECEFSPLPNQCSPFLPSQRTFLVYVDSLVLSVQKHLSFCWRLVASPSACSNKAVFCFLLKMQLGTETFSRLSELSKRVNDSQIVVPFRSWRISFHTAYMRIEPAKRGQLDFTLYDDQTTLLAVSLMFFAWCYNHKKATKIILLLYNETRGTWEHCCDWEVQQKKMLPEWNYAGWSKVM